MPPVRRLGIAVTTSLLLISLAAGCSGGTPSRRPAGPSAATSNGTVHIISTLRIAVTPSSGPVGTTVEISVGGCHDPSGQNHAVSFNNDADNPSARNDPQTVHAVTVRQDDELLTGSYRIQPSDLTGGVGMFFVQCGATLMTAPFSVTRSQ